MYKIIALFLALSVFVAASQNGMHFQTGSSLANLIRSGSRSASRYSGQFAVRCAGGSGSYAYEFRGVPEGWTVNGNQITVPNMLNLNGRWVIQARVVDQNGAALEGVIDITINGLNIVIESSAVSTQNEIILNSVTDGIVAGGPAAGGTPTGPAAGGAPTGPAAGGAPTPDNSALWNSYPGLPADSQNVVPSSGSYPTPASPSGEPSRPNIVPDVIGSAQAPYNPERDSNPVTVDDVKRNAAFNRQLNANKAVANLLSIIQQLTANVNAAQNDIVTLEDLLDQAEGAYNDCNDQIYDFVNTRTKIENAINDRQAKIQEVSAKIGELEPQLEELRDNRADLASERADIENDRSPNADKLAQLESDLEDCRAKHDALADELNGINDTISGLQADAQQIADEAAGAPAAIDQIKVQIPIVDAKINNLKQELADAEAEKQKLLDDQAMYQAMIDNAKNDIAALNAEIAGLESRIPGIQSQIDAAQAMCDSIENDLNDFRDELAQTEADYAILAEEIKVLDNLISDKVDDIARPNNSIKDFPNEIITLQGELARIEESLRRQYFICNDAADDVRAAKQNLAAMQLKYTTESQWLIQANNNLEKARAEKELADLAVEELIAVTSDALPFAIVPSGNGNTDAGTPVGNNAEGNALGPIVRGNTVAPGSPVVVGDLSTYLSSAYGAGVNPAIPSSVTTLYPLSTLTLEAITGQSTAGAFNANPNVAGEVGTFTCGSGNVRGSGQIYSVQSGVIQVQDNNGQIINLNVGSCSDMKATAPTTALVPSMPVYYNGAAAANGSINLNSLACMA